MLGRRVRLPLSGALLLVMVLVAPRQGSAEELVLVLDPALTQVRFTLGATLHTVHGTVRLARGEIRFDPTGGLTSGEIVLDARSATTGIFARDNTMHRSVLESERFPEIVFRPERLALEERTATSATLELHGVLTIHGESHAFVLRANSTASGDRLRATTQFTIPYVAWGMRDASNLLLRVDKEVEVTVATEGTLEAAGSSPTRASRERSGEHR
jgi:polyisoprenoid-binding protein YceI